MAAVISLSVLLKYARLYGHIEEFLQKSYEDPLTDVTTKFLPDDDI